MRLLVRGRLHRPVVLGARDAGGLAGLHDLEPARRPGGLARAQGVGVEADTRPHPARAPPAEAEVHGHGAVGVAGEDPQRGLHGPAAELQLGHLGEVPARRLLGPHPAEGGGRLRADEGHVVPRDLRERPRQLLQPAQVREAAVEDGGVGAERDLEPGRGRGPAGLRPLAGDDLHRLRLEGGAGHDPVVEGAVPALLEVLRAELRLPVGADDVVALRLALAEGGQDLDLRQRVVERRDQRLDDRGRPVGGAQVAPALERVRGGQVPVAALRRLVEVEPVVDPQGHPVEGLREVEVRGGRVDRVRAQDHEDLDRPRLHLRHERREGRRLPDRPGLGGRGVGHGGADRAERLVHRVGDRVDRRRLRLAGDHEGPGSRPLQVLHDRRDPRVVDGALHGDAHARRDRPGEALDLGAAQGQAVVGGGAGRRGRALDDVEPVHLRLRRVHLAAGGELAHEAQAGRVRGDEVGLEAEHDVGLVEAVLRLDRLAEGEHGPRPRVVAPGRLPAHPLRLREGGEDALHLAGEGRRGHAPGQEAQARAPLRLLLLERLAQRRPELAPGPVLADVEHGLRAIGVVQAQDVGLAEGVRPAEARRVLGVALDLGGPALVALHQDPARVAVVAGGGREEERPPRHELLGLPHVGQDLLDRLLRAGGEPGEGERRPHQGHELAAALRVLEHRGLLRELPVQELEEGGRVGELVEALPVAAGARRGGRPAHALELHGNGVGVFLAHRWHVEQVTCVLTSYSAASFRPSSSWLDGDFHATL